MDVRVHAVTSYAVNLSDLTGWKQDAENGNLASQSGMLLMLLQPVLVKETVQAEGQRWDGDAVLVRADMTERFEAIHVIIRDLWKVHKNSGLRIYASKTGRGGWKRI